MKSTQMQFVKLSPYFQLNYKLELWFILRGRAKNMVGKSNPAFHAWFLAAHSPKNEVQLLLVSCLIYVPNSRHSHVYRIRSCPRTDKKFFSLRHALTNDKLLLSKERAYNVLFYVLPFASSITSEIAPHQSPTGTP
jgi:hypothetical protein